MPSYLTELYLARHRRSELASLSVRAHDAARTLIRAGHPVAYLRCAFVPEDEVCVLWFIAPSRAVLSELEHLAKVEFDRVIEELERPAQEEPCRSESAGSQPHVRHITQSIQTTTEEWT